MTLFGEKAPLAKAWKIPNRRAATLVRREYSRASRIFPILGILWVPADRSEGQPRTGILDGRARSGPSGVRVLPPTSLRLSTGAPAQPVCAVVSPALDAQPSPNHRHAGARRAN